MKKIALLVLVATLAITLTACSKTFKCGMCLEEKTGRQYTTQFLGEKIAACHECYSDLKKWADLLKP